MIRATYRIAAAALTGFAEGFHEKGFRCSEAIHAPLNTATDRLDDAVDETYDYLLRQTGRCLPHPIRLHIELAAAKEDLAFLDREKAPFRRRLVQLHIASHQAKNTAVSIAAFSIEAPLCIAFHTAKSITKVVLPFLTLTACLATYLGAGVGGGIKNAAQKAYQTWSSPHF